VVQVLRDAPLQVTPSLPLSAPACPTLTHPSRRHPANGARQVARLADQRRYLSAVGGLNRAFAILWGEDVVAVGGVSATREQVPYLALYLGPYLAPI